MADTKLTVHIRSFSYKKGFPGAVDSHGGGFVFDCRMLPNPGREAAYAPLNGTDAAVAAYIESLPEAEAFWTHVQALVQQAVSAYQKRGFSSLTVWFGCTGGQHRSVYFSERLKHWLEAQTNVGVTLEHLCRLDWELSAP